MRILVAGDVHWGSYSSILRSRGDTYSTRLQGLIYSLNWVENMACVQDCDAVVFLGDFFDRAELNSEEITALKEVTFYKRAKHYFLVGNHEAGRGSLDMSTAHLFNLNEDIVVCDVPQYITDGSNNIILFLPYILESNRRPLKEYIPDNAGNTVVFSHNDLKGLQMGKFISKEGFAINEIESSCRLFVNGHLHNGETVGSNIINLGNLSGQNFSEDADRYRHNILVLDTSDFSVEWHENPYAFNFYKLDFSTYTDDDGYRIQQRLSELRNAVCTIKVNAGVKFLVEDLISTCENIIDSRLIVENTVQHTTEDAPKLVSADHVQQFAEFVKEHVAACPEFYEELLYITAGVK